MNAGMEALNSAQHKAAEVLYRSANAAGVAGPDAGPGAGAGPGAAPGGATDGDVIEAEVVEDEKK
jgi:hypothetical protein